MLLVICLMSGACFAADWQSVSRENGNGTSFFIDMDSVAEDGPFARAWTMENRKKSKTVTLGNKRVNYQSYIALRVFDCRNRRSAIVQGTFYAMPYGRGDVLHSFTSSLTNDLFSAVTPSSMGEALMDAVCEKPPLKKIQT